MHDEAQNSKLNHIHDLLPPPYEWCEIPAGQVTIVGGVHMPDYKETFEVQPFWMGKYHVTFSQFQVFIDEQDGFYTPELYYFSTYRLIEILSLTWVK